MSATVFIANRRHSTGGSNSNRGISKVNRDYMQDYNIGEVYFTEVLLKSYIK